MINSVQPTGVHNPSSITSDLRNQQYLQVKQLMMHNSIVLFGATNSSGLSLIPKNVSYFIALSKESDEGLTPFHKFIGKHIINRSENKGIRIISAIGLYTLYIIPPFLFWVIGFPFILIIVTWMLIYPLMILRQL